MAAGRLLAPRRRPRQGACEDLIVRVRRDGTFLEFAGAKRLWPHPDPASLIGKKIRATLPAAEAETVTGCVNRAAQTGQMQEARLGDVDLRALATGDGQAVLILRAAGDGDEQLREARQTIEAIVEASPLAIFASDAEGRITRWNAAAERTFGWSRSEVLNQRMPFVPQAGEQASAGELSAVRKDGRTVDLKLWSAALPNGCIAIAEDVTEQRRLERELQESQRMETVGRLAGGVAHDFNNLLTVITGYASMVLDEPEDPGAVRAHTEEILRTSERASALTCQLLQFSKPQTAEPKAIAINELILNMDKMLRRVIGEQIELVTALSPDAGNIYADPAQIEQVIMNLVVNARDAVAAGGRITIETAARTLDEGRVVLSVLDSGVGMDEETRARIFEPFFTTKEQGKGTGLGMATVYAIVKQSRGEITVTSAPERGTAIRVYLPRIRRTAPEPDAGPEVGRRQRGTETVLLVEDEDEVRRLLSDVLEHNGYKVLSAAQPQEAIALCTSHDGAIDLLLTDAVLPQMSGRALAEQAGGMRPNLRVLLMSGYTEDALDVCAPGEPGAAFLRKPFTPTLLTQKIREVLDAGEPEQGRSAEAS
jgi:two-component system, cell cycle sensor histidine kinase and response regulator CckA